MGGSCRCATPRVLTAPDYRRRRLRARGGPRSASPALICVLCAVCCVLLSGCVYRSLTIKTDPPGAKVYMNDTLLAEETPTTYDFLWYGGYRVTIRKDGYERLDDHQLIRCPAHLWIPFDLVLELLPIRIDDHREWSYTLTPVQEPPRPMPPVITTPQERATDASG